MTDMTRRGRPLTAPRDGWPDQPAGTPKALGAALKLLSVAPGARRRSGLIHNAADAEAHVWGIAIRLLENLRSAATSPTLHDAHAGLEELARKAQRLARQISSFTGEFGLARAAASESGLFRRVFQDGRAEYRLATWEEALLAPLEALSSMATELRGELGNAAPAKAGRERLFGRLYGDPRVRLGRDCALLLKECRDGEGGGLPPRSDVLALMEAIWRLATGEVPEPGLLDESARSALNALKQRAPRPHHSPRLRGLIGQKIFD